MLCTFKITPLNKQSDLRPAVHNAKLTGTTQFTNCFYFCYFCFCSTVNRSVTMISTMLTVPSKAGQSPMLFLLSLRSLWHHIWSSNATICYMLRNLKKNECGNDLDLIVILIQVLQVVFLLRFTHYCVVFPESWQVWWVTDKADLYCLAAPETLDRSFPAVFVCVCVFYSDLSERSTAGPGSSAPYTHTYLSPLMRPALWS